MTTRFAATVGGIVPLEDAPAIVVTFHVPENVTRVMLLIRTREEDSATTEGRRLSNGAVWKGNFNGGRLSENAA